MTGDPTIERLIREFGFPLLRTSDARDAFVGAPGDHALFIPGERPGQGDTTSIAEILPELQKEFERAFDCAVIDEAIDAETREEVGIPEAPSLVFFRNGLQIGALPRALDRASCIERISQILAARTDIRDAEEGRRT